MVHRRLGGQELEERADQSGVLVVEELREQQLVLRGPQDELAVVRCEVARLVRQRRPEVMEVERPLVVVPRELVPLAAVVPLEREAPMVGHWDAT